MQPPLMHLLPDGRRLHCQHGPIDLVIEATGEPEAVRAAYAAVAVRFPAILPELCEELPELRRCAASSTSRLCGPIARRMLNAVLAHSAEAFITPMAAVAGAVAEDVLAAMVAAAPLSRAFVNNGGDIALHLADGESTRIGLVDRPDRPSLFGTATIAAEDRIRGIATSGWRGRSFSRGIADAVTILARRAADADAAATIVGNAVDLPGHRAIVRRPACEIQVDSDLEDLLVTCDVGALTEREIAEALQGGRACAETLIRRGLIAAAALHLQGETIVVGSVLGAAASNAPGVSAGRGVSRPRAEAALLPFPSRPDRAYFGPMIVGLGGAA